MQGASFSSLLPGRHNVSSRREGQSTNNKLVNESAASSARSQVADNFAAPSSFQPFIYEAGLRRQSIPGSLDGTIDDRLPCEMTWQTFHPANPSLESSTLNALPLLMSSSNVPITTTISSVHTEINRGPNSHSILPSEILRRRKATSRINGYHYNCTECGKQFKKRFYLQRHVLTIHSTNRPVFACNFCGKAFKKKDNLKWHKATKHPDEYDAENRNNRDEAAMSLQSGAELGPPGRYACNACRKIFHFEALWEFHREMHKTKRRAGGRISEKGQQQQQQQQRLNGRNSRSSSLPVNSGLSTPGALPSVAVHRHQRLNQQQHPQSQDRACSICGKRFKRADHLKHHEATHTGLSPFTCNICSKTFLSSSTLYYHKREHWLQEAADNGQSPSVLACQVCGSIFKKEAALRKHTLAKHGTPFS